MASTVSSGWRSSATAAGWFQWGLGEEKGVGELRGPTVELARGSARAEEGGSGGSAAASSLPGLRVDGGGVLGSGCEE